MREKIATPNPLVEKGVAHSPFDNLTPSPLAVLDSVPFGRPVPFGRRFRDGDLAPVAVGYGETAVREQLRKLRAMWNPEAKVWLVPYGKIRGTELEARIPAEFLNGSRKL
jgi:hypothetical protein